jgi:hypothetical protein
MASAGRAQPKRTFYNGEEYISALGAAQSLGISHKTLLRLESRGVIDRPQPIPRGNRGARWYRISDLEAARQALAMKDAPEGRFSWTALRAVADRVVKAPGWRSWSELDGDVVAPPKEEPVSAVLCPACGDEVVFVAGTNPNGQSEMVPFCEHCGEVDLREPEPEPMEGTCVRCGREPVWEVVEPGQGFVAVCVVCGETEVVAKKKPEVESPFSHSVSFPFPATATLSPSRRRGLGPGDVPGVVRKAKPPQSNGPLFVDPRSFGNR